MPVHSHKLLLLISLGVHACAVIQGTRERTEHDVGRV